MKRNSCVYGTEKWPDEHFTRNKTTGRRQPGTNTDTL